MERRRRLTDGVSMNCIYTRQTGPIIPQLRRTNFFSLLYFYVVLLSTFSLVIAVPDQRINYRDNPPTLNDPPSEQAPDSTPGDWDSSSGSNDGSETSTEPLSFQFDPEDELYYFMRTPPEDQALVKSIAYYLYYHDMERNFYGTNFRSAFDAWSSSAEQGYREARQHDETLQIMEYYALDKLGWPGMKCGFEERGCTNMPGIEYIHNQYAHDRVQAREIVWTLRSMHMVYAEASIITTALDRAHDSLYPKCDEFARIFFHQSTKHPHKMCVKTIIDIIMGIIDAILLIVTLGAAAPAIAGFFSNVINTIVEAVENTLTAALNLFRVGSFTSSDVSLLSDNTILSLLSEESLSSEEAGMTGLEAIALGDEPLSPIVEVEEVEEVEEAATGGLGLGLDGQADPGIDGELESSIGSARKYATYNTLRSDVSLMPSMRKALTAKTLKTLPNTEQEQFTRWLYLQTWSYQNSLTTFTNDFEELPSMTPRMIAAAENRAARTGSSLEVSQEGVEYTGFESSQVCVDEFEEYLRELSREERRKELLRIKAKRKKDLKIARQRKAWAKANPYKKPWYKKAPKKPSPKKLSSKKPSPQKPSPKKPSPQNPPEEHPPLDHPPSDHPSEHPSWNSPLAIEGPLQRPPPVQDPFKRIMQGLHRVFKPQDRLTPELQKMSRSRYFVHQSKPRIVQYWRRFVRNSTPWRGRRKFPRPDPPSRRGRDYNPKTKFNDERHWSHYTRYKPRPPYWWHPKFAPKERISVRPLNMYESAMPRHYRRGLDTMDVPQSMDEPGTTGSIRASSDEFLEGKATAPEPGATTALSQNTSQELSQLLPRVQKMSRTFAAAVAQTLANGQAIGQWDHVRMQSFATRLPERGSRGVFGIREEIPTWALTEGPEMEHPASIYEIADTEYASNFFFIPVSGAETSEQTRRGRVKLKSRASDRYTARSESPLDEVPDQEELSMEESSTEESSMEESSMEESSMEESSTEESSMEESSTEESSTEESNESKEEVDHVMIPFFADPYDFFRRTSPIFTLRERGPSDEVVTKQPLWDLESNLRSVFVFANGQPWSVDEVEAFFQRNTAVVSRYADVLFDPAFNATDHDLPQPRFDSQETPPDFTFDIHHPALPWSTILGGLELEDVTAGEDHQGMAHAKFTAPRLLNPDKTKRDEGNDGAMQRAFQRIAEHSIVHTANVLQAFGLASPSGDRKRGEDQTWSIKRSDGTSNENIFTIRVKPHFFNEIKPDHNGCGLPNYTGNTTHNSNACREVIDNVVHSVQQRIMDEVGHTNGPDWSTSLADHLRGRFAQYSRHAKIQEWEEDQDTLDDLFSTRLKNSLLSNAYADEMCYVKCGSQSCGTGCWEPTERKFVDLYGVKNAGSFWDVDQDRILNASMSAYDSGDLSIFDPNHWRMYPYVYNAKDTSPVLPVCRSEYIEGPLSKFPCTCGDKFGSESELFWSAADWGNSWDANKVVRDCRDGPLRRLAAESPAAYLVNACKLYFGLLYPPGKNTKPEKKNKGHYQDNHAMCERILEHRDRLTEDRACGIYMQFHEGRHVGGHRAHQDFTAFNSDVHDRCKHRCPKQKHPKKGPGKHPPGNDKKHHYCGVTAWD